MQVRSLTLGTALLLACPAVAEDFAPRLQGLWACPAVTSSAGVAQNLLIYQAKSASMKVKLENTVTVEWFGGQWTDLGEITRRPDGWLEVKFDGRLPLMFKRLTGNLPRGQNKLQLRVTETGATYICDDSPMKGSFNH